MKSKCRTIFFKLIIVLLIFTPIFNFKVQAASSSLSLNELSFWNIKPNDSVSKSIKVMTGKYKQLVFDHVDGGYISGDPTPKMAYFFEFYTDVNNRVIGIVYEQFMEKDKGLAFITSKGIKVGSSLANVYSKYGKNAKELSSKNPEANYINLSYPIVLKETKQSGNLIIKLRYGKNENRSKARVFGFEYKLSPLDKKSFLQNKSMIYTYDNNGEIETYSYLDTTEDGWSEWLASKNGEERKFVEKETIEGLEQGILPLIGDGGDIWMSLEYPVYIGKYWVDFSDGKVIKITNTNATVKTAAGTFNNVLIAKKTDGTSYYYAQNIGLIKITKDTEVYYELINLTK